MELIWRITQLLFVVTIYFLCLTLLFVLAMALPFVYPLAIYALLIMVISMVTGQFQREALERLQSKRIRRIGLEEFVKAADDCGASRRILSSVYRTLWQDVFSARPYPIRPSDNLALTYDIGRPSGMSMEVLMQKLSRGCGIPLEALDWEMDPPQTVQGLVRFLAERERGRKPGSPALLLRPAIAPPATESLLRPASSPDNTRTEALLRPVDPTHTILDETSVPIEGEGINYDRNAA